jgi:hypothetical protein
LPPAVHIVFSRRESDVSRLLGVPGFAAVGRYHLVPALDEHPDRFTGAVIYEIERSVPEAMTALAAVPSAGLSASWLADPLGPRVERGRNEGTIWAKSLQLVFSDAGDADHPVSDQSFDGWYERHLDEILSIPGFTSAQRYRLETVTRPEGGTIPGRRLCVYTTSKPPAELRAEMERMNLLSADSYSRLKDDDSSGPALPEWWDTVRFASWNLIPAGPAL